MPYSYLQTLAYTLSLQRLSIFTSSPAPTSALPGLTISCPPSLTLSNLFPPPPYPRPARPSSYNFFPNKSPTAVALMSVTPGTSPHPLRTLPSLPVLQLAHPPLTPRPFPSPPALLQQALLAVAKLHSRALWPHPGLRHRLLSEERRPYRFAPQGSRSRSPPPKNIRKTHGGWAQGDALHPVTAAAVNAASAAVSIPATPTSGSKNYNSQEALRRPAAPGMHRSTQSEAALASDCGPWPLACGRAPG